MEVEKENQNGNEINETKNEPKVEITEEQKDETKDLVGHGGQGKRTFRTRTNSKLERRYVERFSDTEILSTTGLFAYL